MTVKEYLQQAYKIHRRMRVLRAQIEALREIATCASPHTDSVRVDGTSNRGNRMAAVDKWVDLERRLERESRRLRRQYAEIKAVIDAVENDTYRELLSLRYLAFMGWADVAEVIGYSHDHARGYLHRKALQEIKINTD